jgi:O-antigen/teichoic acid export membrane protein
VIKNSILQLFGRISFHTIIYGVSGVINKLAELILLPIFTRFLTQTEIGELDILLLSTNILFIILQYGLGSALIKYSLYDENLNRKVLFSTALYTLIGLNIVLVTVLSFFSEKLSYFFFSGSEYGLAIKYLIFSVFFNTLTIIPLAYLRSKNASIKYASLISFKFITQLLLNIIFVVFLKYKIIGIVYATLANNLLYAIVSVWLIRKELSPSFNYEYIRRLFQFGIYLIPLAMMPIFINLYDRYLIIKNISSESVAIYSIGFKTAQIVYLAVAAFQVAWPYFMYTIVKQENAKKIFSQLFKIYFFLLNSLALGISLFSYKLIPIVFGDSYLQSFQHNYLISFGYLFMGLYFFTAVGLNINNKTNIQSIVVIVAGSIKIIIALPLLYYYSLNGIAVSVLINFFLIGISATVLSLKYYYFEISLIKIITIIVSELLLMIYFNHFFPAVYELRIYYIAVIYALIVLTTFILVFWGTIMNWYREITA